VDGRSTFSEPQSHWAAYTAAAGLARERWLSPGVRAATASHRKHVERLCLILTASHTLASIHIQNKKQYESAFCRVPILFYFAFVLLCYRGIRNHSAALDKCIVNPRVSTIHRPIPNDMHKHPAIREQQPYISNNPVFRVRWLIVA